GREGGVAAELAMQDRLVAEPVEVGAVGGIRRGEGGGHGAGFLRRRGRYLSLDSFRALMTSAVTARLRPGSRPYLLDCHCFCQMTGISPRGETAAEGRCPGAERRWARMGG